MPGANARYAAIFEKYRPPGIKVRWKRGRKLSPAHANLRKAEMLVPPLASREALGFAIHECGHFWLRHFSPNEAPTLLHRDLYTKLNKLTLAQQEYEAERWTIAVMRFERVPVSRELRGLMRTYVAECLDQDTPKRRTPSQIRKWSTR